MLFEERLPSGEADLPLLDIAALQVLSPVEMDVYRGCIGIRGKERNLKLLFGIQGLGFPNIRGPVLGLAIIWIHTFLGLYGGPLLRETPAWGLGCWAVAHA